MSFSDFDKSHKQLAIWDGTIYTQELRLKNITTTM